MEKLGIHLLLPEEDAWPHFLGDVTVPPALLYVRGREEFLSVRTRIALVGSRRSDPRGLALSRRIGAACASEGRVVVSGGALGIDTAAHEAALEAGGATVAVLGSGLSRVYPGSNRGLFERIVEHGALVSEQPLFEPGKACHFPFRNRIIAGLSQVVVIIQARRGSGALHTAAYAQSSGRRLFVVPDRFDDDSANEGGNRLLEQGVAPLTGLRHLAEVLSEFGGPPRRSSVPEDSHRPKVLVSRLDPGLLPLLRLLSQGVTHVDDLSRGLNEGHGALSAGLLELEMNGMVEKRVGNHYICNVRLEE